MINKFIQSKIVLNTICQIVNQGENPLKLGGWVDKLEENIINGFDHYNFNILESYEFHLFDSNYYRGKSVVLVDLYRNGDIVINIPIFHDDAEFMIENGWKSKNKAEILADLKHFLSTIEKYLNITDSFFDLFKKNATVKTYYADRYSSKYDVETTSINYEDIMKELVNNKKELEKINYELEIEESAPDFIPKYDLRKIYKMIKVKIYSKCYYIGSIEINFNKNKAITPVSIRSRHIEAHANMKSEQLLLKAYNKKIFCYIKRYDNYTSLEFQKYVNEEKIFSVVKDFLELISLID